MKLLVDKTRTENHNATGIFIRALDEGTMVNADIAELEKASLLEFLRSRGGENKWAENVVGILLGHGNLHES